MNGAFRERIAAPTLGWDRLPLLVGSRRRRPVAPARWFIAGAVVGAVVEALLR